jgi:hypothetical protein
MCFELGNDQNEEGTGTSNRVMSVLSRVCRELRFIYVRVSHLNRIQS